MFDLQNRLVYLKHSFFVFWLDMLLLLLYLLRRMGGLLYILVNIDFNIPNTKVTALTNTDVYDQLSKV